MNQLDPASRRVTSVSGSAFNPYDRLGKVVPGLSWLPLSPESNNGGHGCFAVRFDKGARSELHQHQDAEEFYVLDGELIDEDGTRMKAGDFVRFEPGTEHWSHAPDGATILVFLRSPNQLIGDAQQM